MKKLLLSTAALAVITLSAGAVQAASNTATADAEAVVLVPVSVEKDQDMNFGSFAVNVGVSNGTLKTDGTASGVQHTGASAPAKFEVTGAGNFSYIFSVEDDASAAHDQVKLSLIGGTGTVGTDAMVATLTGAGNYTLSFGSDTVTVSGELTDLVHTLLPGSYVGTMKATVTYP